jgi:CRISPR-associated protein Csm1
MVFIGGKYPVYQAAKDAAEAERQAKNLEGKNAFSFLGNAWAWPEFDKIVDKQAYVQRLVADKEIEPDSLEGPQAIMGVLKDLALAETEGAKERGRPVWGPWLWRGPYQLTRMVERHTKNKPQLAEAITQLRDVLNEDDYGEIDQWGVAARWTQLYIRKSTVRKER